MHIYLSSFLLIVSASLTVSFEKPSPASLLVTQSLKNSIKKLGEKCMTSVGATMEEMDSIKHGPPYKGKASCAVGCILEKGGVITNKTFNKAGLTAVAMPFLLGDAKKINHIKAIGNSCEKDTAADHDDECKTAEDIIICLRKEIPQMKELDL